LKLHTRGYRVFLPHLFAFWHTIHPHAREEWIELDLAWLARCDALLRVPGESPGADLEVRRAGELGIPVFGSIAELDAWAAAPPVGDVAPAASGNGV
jgi:hypothetical protein